MAKSDILKGHKRVKKRFIPPIAQISNLREVSYVNDILPEIIWMGLIIDELGPQKGVSFIRNILSYISDIVGKPNIRNHAFMSNFEKMNADQKNDLILKLNETGILEALREHISPLVILYDDCPLSFFGLSRSEKGREILIARMKDCVKKYFDRFSENAGLILAPVLLANLIDESITFAKDLKLPDFNSIINSRGSEEASRASAFLRSFVLTETHRIEIDKTWAWKFWNKGYELTSCELKGNDHV